MAEGPLLQWNCRGLRANYEELLLICKNYKPVVVGLQETHLQPSVKTNVAGYSFLRKDSHSGTSIHGVALLISSSVLFSEVKLDTPLQAVAARVSLHRTITVCSLYLPPSETVSKDELLRLFSQLPAPFIILGDFNGHSPLWGSDDHNTRGREVEKAIEEFDLSVFNDRSPTYVHPASNSHTVVDLSVCDPTLLLDFDWLVHDDQCGSDHFPIVLTPSKADEDDTPAGRWNFKKADWKKFSDLCETNITEEHVISAQDPALAFTSLLTDIADSCIPRATTVRKGPRLPWFNHDCQNIQRQRKTAQRRKFRNPSLANILNFKRLRAKARRTFRDSRKHSWKEFVSKLSSKTSSRKVWKTIRKIKGKGGSSSVSHLRVGDKLVTEKQAVANLLASTISKNSSSSHYSAAFQKFKETKEAKPCDFLSDGSESYNRPFTKVELKQALQKANDSAAGLDQIHYKLLTHLPDKTLDILLFVFNHIWDTGIFPQSWRQAEVVPIPKQGRDLSNPGNYRPIALTSCICKTMERLVNTRLVWFLESNNLISDLQCGFRQGRSTVDHLVRFETFVREAFVKKQHVLAVFFDLEKAYDTTWKSGILSDMHEMGFRGRLPIFIREFLSDRSFRVRVGSTLSDPFDQEMGVPQGSILSPALFSIKINGIVAAVKKDTDASLFVDDFSLCVRGSSLHRVERALQLSVNSVQSWVSDNGFKFSPTKTTCVHFTQRRGVFPDPNIVIEGTPVPTATEVKFLGVIFDQKLNFISHIKYLRNSCQKALDVLRVVGHTDWGADRTVLLRLYRSLVRSKLDYGCIVWGSARKSYTQMLDPIHHQGIRICLGAFRTSPVESLYVEAGEPSLYSRRIRLAMNYVLKLRSNPDNPAYKCVFKPSLVEEFENSATAIPPLSLRVRPHFEKAGIDLEQVEETLFPVSPPWKLPTPEVWFDLTKFQKSNTPDHIYKEELNSLLEFVPGFHRIFTDGSKSEDGKAGAAAVSMEHPHQPFKHRLLDNSSIYSAELQAILLALKKVYQSKDTNFLILSDSKSSLEALNSKKMDHPLLVEILELYNSLLLEDKDIIFIWVPSHIGIRGNTLADQAAKEALSGPVNSKHSVYNDFKPLVIKYMSEQWQVHWDKNNSERGNKLHGVVPNIRSQIPRVRCSRREEVVLARLHVGHSYLTHSFILKKEEPPFCVACDSPDTIEHMLISCADLIEVRNNFYSSQSMELLFRNVPPDRIIGFLKEINVYSKI